MNSSTLALPSTLQMLLGLYGFLLPLLLYVLWTTLALWDLGKRTDLTPGRVWLWTATVFLLPFVGPVAYLIVGGGPTSSRVRAMTVGGGACAYVLVLLLGAWTGMS